MKVRIEKNKNTGDTCVDYSKVRQREDYRRRLLNAVLRGLNDDLTVYIDTNMRTGPRFDRDLDGYLERTGARFVSTGVDAKPRKYFGINVGSLIGEKKKADERVMVFEAPHGFFSTTFDRFLINMDIAVGIGRRRSFEEVCRAFLEDADAVMFNTDWFDTFLYDAAGCGMLRSSLDISQAANNLEL